MPNMLQQLSEERDFNDRFITRRDSTCRTTPSLISPSHTGTCVIAATDIPAKVVSGPFTEDFLVGYNTFDNPVINHAIEVRHAKGTIIADNDSLSQWIMYIQPARDRHEQNLEAYRDSNRNVFIRTARSIKKNEQLFVWYSDDYAREMGIPILTPENIKGNQKYVCSKCDKSYSFPNSLKAHMRFRCAESRADILRQLNETPLNLQQPTSFRSVFEGSSLFQSKSQSKQSKEVQDLTVSPTSTRMFNSTKKDSPKGPMGLHTSSASAFKPHRKVVPIQRREMPQCDSKRMDLLGRPNAAALNLSLRDGKRSPQSAYPLSSMSQPIQIFNHIHTPPLSLPLDQATLRIYCPFRTPVSDQQTRLFCGNILSSPAFSNPQETLYLPYGYPLSVPHTGMLRNIPKGSPDSDHSEKLTEQEDNLREFRMQSGLTFPIPMPSDTAGEPLDLLPRSLFVSKSKKGHLCIYCGKLYSRKYGLKIHLRTHTGYKPLKCKVCLRPFGDPSNLNKHIRLHSEGDTPYRCEFCGKVLVRRRDLERHVKSRHPDAADKLNTLDIQVEDISPVADDHQMEDTESPDDEEEVSVI